MKLRIKETGEIVELVGEIKRSDGKPDFVLDSYDTLDELCKAVEDYKEPSGIKEIFFTGATVNIAMYCQEEAEKTVEKLKAWTRLKDKGVMFKEWFWDKNYGTCIIIGTNECGYVDDGDEQNKKDLDLLFGR